MKIVMKCLIHPKLPQKVDATGQFSDKDLRNANGAVNCDHQLFMAKPKPLKWIENSTINFLFFKTIFETFLLL